MKAANLKTRTAISTVDITVEGKQHGHLIVPCPSTRSAMGTVQIPVCIIKNGEGPTVTLLAGSHGDEYDGQIALQNLITSIEVDDVNGCLIIAPTMNPCAAASHSALTQIDNKDLDTCFPGNAAGTISEQIAALLFSTIIEPADLVVEIRSGGQTTVSAALACVQFNTEHKEQQQLSEEAMIAFGAPYSARLLPEHTGSIASVMQEYKKAFIGVCLGGGGSANARNIEIAQTGCRNVLVQHGVLSTELVLRSTRMLEVTSDKNYLMAPSSGLLDLCKDAGDEVYMGSPIARIISPGCTGTLPTVLKADRNGILMARHHSGRIEQGDCIAIIADEVQR